MVPRFKALEYYVKAITEKSNVNENKEISYRKCWFFLDCLIYITRVNSYVKYCILLKLFHAKKY